MKTLNAQKVLGFIQILQVAASVGFEVVGKAKQLLAVFHPDHALTDEEINAIERVSLIDYDARIAARKAMAGQV